MQMSNAFRLVLSQYATFSGRAGRGEFWWSTLAVFLISVVLTVIEVVIFGSDAGGGVLSGIFGVAILLPMLAVAARRLHDTDRSAWWLLLYFVPILGSLVLIVFYVLRGTPGDNRFGAPGPLV